MRETEECRKKYENLAQIEFDRYHKEKNDAKNLKKMRQNLEIEKISLSENPTIIKQLLNENENVLMPLVENNQPVDQKVSKSLESDKTHLDDKLLDEAIQNELKPSIENQNVPNEFFVENQKVSKNCVEEKKPLDNQLSKPVVEEKSPLDNSLLPLAEEKITLQKNCLEENQKMNKNESSKGKEQGLLRFDLKTEEKNSFCDPQVIY